MIPPLVVVAACTARQNLPPRGPGTTPPADSAAGPAGVDSASDPSPTGSGSLATADTGDTTVVPPRLFAYVGSDDDRIRVFSVDLATGDLTWTSEVDAGAGPSFLAFSPDRRHLYAANEGSDEVSAFAIDPSTGALTFLNRVPSNGRGPAHVTVDATGRWVFAANYGGGTVTMIEIAGDGSLGSAVETLATGPNAHQLVVDPSNRYAFVPNLGSDDVSQLVIDVTAGTLTENAVPRVSLAPGAGPRHLVFHPSAPFAWLIDETDDTMVALAFDVATGRLSPVQTVSTLPIGVDGADSYGAEVALGPSGRFLYGSNRGHDSIVVFAVDPTTGSIAQVADENTGGDWPRHFSIDPTGELLVVGNQRSDTVVSFRVDPVSGGLTAIATVGVPGPAYVGIVDIPL